MPESSGEVFFQAINETLSRAKTQNNTVPDDVMLACLLSFAESLA